MMNERAKMANAALRTDHTSTATETHTSTSSNIDYHSIFALEMSNSFSQQKPLRYISYL